MSTEYRFTCEAGHTFERQMTREQFIDRDHVCDCGKPAKRSRFSLSQPLPAGGKAPGCRAQYPYYNWQLPVLPGQKPGDQIVQSRQHEREICAGGWNGERWEMNQL